MDSLTRNLTMALAAAAALGAGCGPGDDDGGGACADILPGELVITEVFADSSGEDDGKEWFEIYNAASAPIDLAGLTLLHSRPDGASDGTHVMEATTLGAGEYLVLGNVLPEFVTAHLDYGYGNDLGQLFNSGSGKLSISCGSDVIDEILYEEAPAATSVGFDGGAAPDYTANDDLTAWCSPPEEAAYEFEVGNFGTPGSTNFDCDVVVAGMCDDGGTLRPSVTPAAGDLVITEVHPNPSGTDDVQEWFEVYATRDVDLNGLGVARASTTTPNIVSSSSCLRVTAGSYAVLARSDVAADNGMLPRVDARYGSITLADPGDLQIMMGATVLDAFAWSNAPSGASYALDPDFLTAADNDMERYWCASTTAWAGGDEGTPGAGNGECEIAPPAGECFDPPGSTTSRAIVVPTAGQLVITEVMPTPTAPVGSHRWFEARATAAIDLNGLKLQRIGATPGTNTVTSNDCLPVAAGGYALFANAQLPADNGGLPAVDGLFTFALIDTCIDPGAGTGCGLQIATAADVVLDVVTWDNATTAKARQLDPDLVTDPAGNDTRTNWCDATNLYNATDTGTPKADNNLQCP